MPGTAPRSQSFGDVLKHAGIYGLGSIGIRVAGLFLVPLYTYNLTPAEFGIMEYLDLTAVFLGMLFSLGLSNAIYRFYYATEDPAERRRIVSTALLPVLVIATTVSAAMIAVAPLLADRLFHDPRFRHYLTVVFLGFGFNAVAEFGMTYLAARMRSAAYSSITVAKFVVGALLNIWFLVGLHLGVRGILYSNLATNVALGLVLLWHVIHENGVAFSPSIFRGMVGYGYPLVLVQLSLFGINFADRFFLQAYGGFGQVGVYALAYKFGIMLNTFFVASFFQVWNAKSFEVAADPGAGAFYTRVFTYFASGLIAAGLGMSLIVRDVIGILAPPTYGAAAGLVPLIVLCYVFNGVGTYFELGLKLRNRTGRLGIIFAGTCILCLALYRLWIPRFGMFGAVAATGVAFLVKALWVHLMSQRLYPIRFEFGRVGRLAAVALATLAIRLLLPPLPRAVSLTAGVLLFVLFVGAVLLSGWLRPEESAGARAMLRRSAQWVRTAASGGRG